jgi:signal transduction histidine kinase
LPATIVRTSGRLDQDRAGEGGASRRLRTSEEILHQRIELLQNTLENMEEGVSVFDRQERLVAWNSRFVELLDLPEDFRGGTALAQILWLQAERGDFGPVDCAEAVSARRKDFFVGLPAVRERTSATGRILQIRRRAMPDGGVMTLYADITEQRAAEVKTAQARAEAEFANRSKSEFLAHMSHELRTPLNAIIGFSELICHGVLGPILDKKLLEYIGDIHASGLHLLTIVNDVLDMSKIEAGKLELAFEWLVVQQVIAETTSMVSELASRRGLDIAVSVPSNEATIFVDERAIKQIVLNLLSNAIKFSNEGGRVEIRAAIDESGGFVLDIEDHGIGMSSDDMKRALQPFGQANPITTRTYGGTGLGLPIVKGLVDAHHGRLVIESTAGEGTLVRVLLPAPSGAASPRNGPSPEPRSGSDPSAASG